MSRSASHAMPETMEETMAGDQLLLNFPPAANKMDEWRATIQILLGFVEINKLMCAELT